MAFAAPQRRAAARSAPLCGSMSPRAQDPTPSPVVRARGLCPVDEICLGLDLGMAL